MSYDCSTVQPSEFRIKLSTMLEIWLEPLIKSFKLPPNDCFTVLKTNLSQIEFLTFSLKYKTSLKLFQIDIPCLLENSLRMLWFKSHIENTRLDPVTFNFCDHLNNGLLALVLKSDNTLLTRWYIRFKIRGTQTIMVGCKTGKSRERSLKSPK